MTRKQKFQCDWCQAYDTYDPRLIHGVYWLPNGGLEYNSPDVTDLHLCGGCLRAIRALPEPPEDETNPEGGA